MRAGLGDQHCIVAQHKSQDTIQPTGITATVLGNQPVEAMANLKEKKWNTEHLGQRLAVDAACAASAGFLVAPIVSMVDK